MNDDEQKRAVLNEGFLAEVEELEARTTAWDITPAKTLRTIVERRIGKTLRAEMLRGIHTEHDYFFNVQDFERNYKQRMHSRTFVRDFHLSLFDYTLLQRVEMKAVPGDPLGLRYFIEEADRPRTGFHDITIRCAEPWVKPEGFVRKPVSACQRAIVDYRTAMGVQAGVVSTKSRVVDLLEDARVQPYQLGVLNRLVWDAVRPMLRAHSERRE